MSQYPVLPKEAAQAWLAYESGNEEVDSPELGIEFRPCKLAYPENVEQTLRLRLDETMKFFGRDLKKSDGGKVESLAVSRVHSSLRSLPMEVLVDPEFWIYLSIAVAKDFVEWRFGASVQAHPSNYGLQSISEGLLFRLYLRGEIAFDDRDEDPYRFSRMGTMDLWRSHILRVNYGKCRPIARALLLLQEEQLAHQPLSTRDVRELAKELKRVYSNVAFEVLSDEEAQALVLELAERSMVASSNAV